MLHLFKYHAKYKQQNKLYQFWQKTNHPILLDNASIFDQKLNYIHANPVRARIVNQEDSFVFSSANPDQPIKLCY
ncbi:MAG: transposase, partial [Bacteroidetes bacterium]|nr:transposase [Bacteroidota bacterium]